MADSGTFKHWEDGQPYGTVEVTANQSGTFKYWEDGNPWGTVYPAAAAVVSDFTAPARHIFHR